MLRQATLAEAAERIYSGYALTGRDRTGTELARFIQISDIESTDVKPYLEETPVESVGKLQRARVQPGDVLVSSRGNGVKAAMVPPAFGEAYISSSLIGVRLTPLLRPQVLVAFLHTPEGRDAILRRLSGSTIPTLTTRQLSSVAVRIPPPHVQDELVTALMEHQRLRHATLRAIRLRDSLMEEAVRRHVAPAPEEG